MDIKDFIISNLERISNEIGEVKFIYNFNSETKTHIIFVLPNELRLNSNSYINLEYDLWKAIFRDYPNDDVLITYNNYYERYYENTIVITNN